ncbi:LysR family transcriptional regulator [Marinomonas ostreistagni]|uniref:LysR family transcriptional regulator n=1 Tax=Marinomonas ostreistagni TaxID=359209 RepID=UPI00195298E3|nr:LysR family transcriptional regulator [Marinomonas ostreistagni]MBM6550200.1 LysR family transcriptional regulator [Marinomonas ostreistagni]
MNSLDQIDLYTLRIFVAVFRTLNFSTVARREGVSASKISRTISQLEDSLGEQLFYRSTRAIVATEAGHVLMQHAQTALSEMNHVRTELNNRKAEPTGLVRINAPVFFGQNHIAPGLKGLTQRFPNLTLELMLTDDFIDPHQEGVDVTFRIAHLLDSSLHAHIFAEQHYYLAAAPSYLAQHELINTPEQLRQHQCLVYKGNEGPNRWLCKQLESEWQQLPIKAFLASNNADTLLRCALDGIGLVLFPDWLIGQHLHSGALVKVLPGHFWAINPQQQHVAAIYPNTRHSSRHLRAVIEYFSDYFGKPPYWQH